MKNMRKLLWAFLILLPMDITAQVLADSTAQAGDTVSMLPRSQTKSVKLLARAYGDSIVLRWATEDAGLWISSKDNGWMLFRASADDPDTAYSIDRYGDTIPFVALNGGKPIKPLTLDEMMQRFDSTNFYAGVGAQALYGKFEYNVNESASKANLDFLSMAAKQYQEQTQRHFMAMLAAECDPQVASAIGLRFVDRDVKPGEYYEYILQSLIPPDFADMESPEVQLSNYPYERTEEEMIPDITVTQLDAYRVAVRWDKNKLSGYYIDRRDDADTAWRNLNTQAPVWPMLPTADVKAVMGDSVARWMKNEVVYIDSLEINHAYSYRVRAFDAFGGNPEPRTTETFRMADLIPPEAPILNNVFPVDNRVCKLTWTNPAVTDDISGYVVVFSRKMTGRWKAVSDLLPASATSYEDKNAGKRGRGFYRVFVTDTSGNANYSNPVANNIEDVIAPEAPTGLAAVAKDTNGSVFIHWNPNHDEDLLAYKVYFANQKDHDFIERSKGYLYDTLFYDTVNLNSLTHHIYYYVIAVDNSHNFSATSDTLCVALPDLLPPGVCVLKDIHQEGDSVIINWYRSSSDDIANFYIYRKPHPTPNWECIAKMPVNTVISDSIVSFVDKPGTSIHPWDYCIEVRDSSANSSGMSGHAVIRVEKDPLVKMDISLKAKYKKGKTTLTWNYTYDGLKDYYGVVYRQDGDGEFRDIGTFSRKDASYVDTKAPAKSKCTYYIQLQLGRGQHSSPSNQVSVKTK